MKKSEQQLKWKKKNKKRIKQEKKKENIFS
jgi:hypothetical protein